MKAEDYDLNQHAGLFAIRNDQKHLSYQRGGKVSEGPLSEMVRIVAEDFEANSLEQLSSMILLDGVPSLTKVSDILAVYRRTK